MKKTIRIAALLGSPDASKLIKALRGIQHTSFNDEKMKHGDGS